MNQYERLFLIGVAGIVLGLGVKFLTDSRAAQMAAQNEQQTRQMYESAAKVITEKSQAEQWQRTSNMQNSPPPQNWLETCRNNSGTQPCIDYARRNTGKI
jgi:hypothetical protein